ncbi:MAG: 50S ribosomal protein L3, partial [Candidatus Gottesmanbacteria bacterium GW2011_GWC2_39_8]
RDGQDRVSIRGLRVAIVDNDKNIIAVSGAVPGAKGTLVEITSQ